MWDLMRGRGAASLPLGTGESVSVGAYEGQADKAEAEMVKFSPQGTHFAVLYPKKIEIYSLTLKLLHTLTGNARFNALLFSLLPGEEDEEEKELLCVGTEKGAVDVYTVELAQAQDDEEKDSEDEDEEDQDESGKSGAIVTKIGSFIGHTNRYVRRYLGEDRY